MSIVRVCVGFLLGALVGGALTDAAWAAAPVRVGGGTGGSYVHSRVLDRVRETGEERVIVVMGDPSLQEARAWDWRRRGAAIEELGRRVVRAAPSFQVTLQYRVFPFLAGRADEAALRELRACPSVEGIYPDRLLKAALDQSGPLIGQDVVEAAGHVGAGVGIAILDSGIDYAHPDLGGGGFPNAKVVGGYDFVNDDGDPMDDEGHGTFVAGVAAGEGATYRGIAPGASLIALKVLDSTGIGYSQDVINAIQWCITNQATYNIKVINLSLSDGAEWTDPDDCAADPEGQAIADAVANGMVVVAAAGNEGYLGGVGIPACAPDAIAVGGTYDAAFGYDVAWISCTDETPGVDDICCWSNRGELLDVWAPGGVITSAKMGGSYESSGGTSAAAPHVAGAAAVVFGIIGGGATPTQVRQRLQRTGVQIVDPVTDVATPRIDLESAWQNEPTSGPDLVVTQVEADTSSGLVGDAVQVRVTVENQGDSASGACTALVVLSANQVASPYDGVVATVAVPARAAGGSYASGWVNGTIPAVTPGEYWVGGYVDSGYAVAEKNETNNARAGAGMTVSGLSSYVVSNSIPASMLKGQTYAVSVRMWNTGSTAWTTGEGYALGAVSPKGTGRWGISQVPLPGAGTVAAGGTVTFNFNVTAPNTAGLYACHWQMKKGSVYFGEVATGATKIRLVDDTVYGQQFPAISGQWAAYEDYGGLYRDWGIPAISATYLPTLSRRTLPEDIPFERDGTGAPYPPYEYFDISYHYWPDISGTWVTWVVDDRPENKADPYSGLWYFQVTAYDVQAAGTLPLRIVYDDWDAMFPAIDGSRVVWEDYRNDPNGLWEPWDFLNDNSDIYLYDIDAGQSYPLCTAPGPQLAPRIAGDLVVWEDWRDTLEAQSDVYLYDLSVDTDGDGTPNWKDSDRPDPDPAEAIVTDTWWSEQYPDVSGSRVVWLDLRRDAGLGTTVDMYLRDLESPTETMVVTDPATVRAQPRIDGRKVTWTDWRESSADVYWMEVVTGAGGAIAGGGGDEGFSDISGDRVTYEKHRSTVGDPPYEWYVYNVWVQEMLQEGSVGVHTFTDVLSDFWAWRDVEAIVANNVAGGYGATYEPSWIVSRDQMAVYIARARAGGDGNVPDGPAEPTFTDVPNTGYGEDGTEPHWAYKYIEYCAHPAQNVVGGIGDGTYRPEWEVDRGQMAAFIARGMVAGGQSYFETYVPSETPRFPDVTQENEWAWIYPYVDYIADKGVTGGYLDGLYHPEYLCSRDQMAAYVRRAFGYEFP